jgi:N-acetyl-anhydromuramyl-L-alanine amidase AmpD
LFLQTYRKDIAWPLGHGWGHNIGTAKQPVYARGRGKGIKAISIIVHATHGNPGSLSKNEANFLQDSKNVSAHYLLGRSPGENYKILPPDEEAWHAGQCQSLYRNPQSIGIEIHAAVNEPILDFQKHSLAQLLQELCSAYVIPAQLVQTHRAVAIPRGRKSDPNSWPEPEWLAWRKMVLGA